MSFQCVASLLFQVHTAPLTKWVQFKGLLSFQQYLLMKPIKWGWGGGGVKLLDPLWKRNGLHIQLPSVHQHGPAEGGAWPWLPSCHWLGSYMLHYSIFTSMPLMKNLKLLGIQTRRSCLQLLCWGRTGNHCGDMSSMWPSKMNLCLSTGRIQSLFVCYPPPTVWLNVALSGDNWIDGGSG